MPRLAVWLVRAALLHLGIGFTFGALMLANKGVPFEPRLWLLRPAHIELLIFGWLMQLAMGVAFWILPRFAAGAYRKPEARYGKQWLVWLTFGLFNSGIIVTAAATWLNLGALLVFVGRALELAGVVTFVLGMWARVKPFAEQKSAPTG